MKAQPKIFIYGEGYKSCEPKEATHLQLHLPGPFPNRIIPVMIGGTRDGTPNWTWNGSVDSPTVKPSVLTRGGGEYKGKYFKEHVCHSFVNDGMVQFLGDCTHEFAGMTMDLIDIEVVL